MIEIGEVIVIALFTFIAGLIIGSMLEGIGKIDPNAGGLLDYQFQQFLKKEGITLNVHVTSEDINKYFRDDLWMST